MKGKKKLKGNKVNQTKLTQTKPNQQVNQSKLKESKHITQNGRPTKFCTT